MDVDFPGGAAARLATAPVAAAEPMVTSPSAPTVAATAAGTPSRALPPRTPLKRSRPASPPPPPSAPHLPRRLDGAAIAGVAAALLSAPPSAVPSSATSAIDTDPAAVAAASGVDPPSLLASAAAAAAAEDPRFARAAAAGGRLDLVAARGAAQLGAALGVEGAGVVRTLRVRASAVPNVNGGVASGTLRLVGWLLPDAAGDGQLGDWQAAGGGAGGASAARNGARQDVGDVQMANGDASGSTGSGGTPMQQAAPVGSSAVPASGADKSTAPPAPSVPTVDEGRAWGSTSAARFTDLVQRVLVACPDGRVVDWCRGAAEAPVDGIELSIPGLVASVGASGGAGAASAGTPGATAALPFPPPPSVRVFLYLKESPTTYGLSLALGRVLNMRRGTIAAVHERVWEYVTRRGLHCVDDRTVVRLDAPLQALFPPPSAERKATEVLKLQFFADVLRSHLHADEPVLLRVPVGSAIDSTAIPAPTFTAGASAAGAAAAPQPAAAPPRTLVVDLRVRVADKSAAVAARPPPTAALGSSLPAVSARLEAALAAAAAARRRRAWYAAFAADPAAFTAALVQSAGRDAAVAGGAAGDPSPEAARRAAFYRGGWLAEAVPAYLLGKQVADTAAATHDGGGAVRAVLEAAARAAATADGDIKGGKGGGGDK